MEFSKLLLHPAVLSEKEVRRKSDEEFFAGSRHCFLVREIAAARCIEKGRTVVNCTRNSAGDGISASNPTITASLQR
jgi:hypothetical protein